MKTACSRRSGVVLKLAFGELMTSFECLHFWSWIAGSGLCISVDPISYEQSMSLLFVVAYIM